MDKTSQDKLTRGDDYRGVCSLDTDETRPFLVFFFFLTCVSTTTFCMLLVGTDYKCIVTIVL